MFSAWTKKSRGKRAQRFSASVTYVYSLSRHILFRSSHPSTIEKIFFRIVSCLGSQFGVLSWILASNQSTGVESNVDSGWGFGSCVWAMVLLHVLLEDCNVCWRWRSSVPAAEEYWEQLLSRSYLAGWLDNSLQPLLEFWAIEDFRRTGNFVVNVEK